MAYNPNVPLAGQSKQASQPIMLDNFQEIYNFTAQDHESVDAVAALQGKHKQAVFTQQAAAPVTLATENALYVKECPFTTPASPQLYFRRESSGQEVPITAWDVNAGGHGFYFTPGGLLVKWGNVVIPAAILGAITVTFDAVSGFPVFSAAPAPFECRLTLQCNADCNKFVYSRTIGALTMEILVVARNNSGVYTDCTLNYIVIGALA